MIDHESPDGSYADKFRDAPTYGEPICSWIVPNEVLFLSGTHTIVTELFGDPDSPFATTTRHHDAHRKARYRAKALEMARGMQRADLVERLERG